VADIVARRVRDAAAAAAEEAGAAPPLPVDLLVVVVGAHAGASSQRANAAASRTNVRSVAPAKISVVVCVASTAAAAAATVLNERQSGDRVTGAVLADFPRNAFDVTAESVRVSLDRNRQVQLEVPYRIRWNYNYLVSLGETLGATAQQPVAGFCDRYPNDRNCASTSYVHLISGRPPSGTGRWFGWNNTYGYQDSVRVDQIRQAVAATRPQVRLTVLDDGNRTLFRRCVSHPELDHNIGTQAPRMYFAEFQNSPVRAVINGDLVIRAQESINIGSDTRLLENMYRVDLQVVRQGEC
jgi:hypothetical protein